jgi:hypothetical protein
MHTGHINYGISSVLFNKNLKNVWFIKEICCVYDIRFSRRRIWRMPFSGIYKRISYFTGDTLRLQNNVQTINAMWYLIFLQRWLWRMSSSGMLRHVAFVRTDVSEKLSTSIIRVTRIGELRILAVTSNRKPVGSWLLLTFLARRFLSPDDGGAKFLRNVGSYKSHTA